MSEERTVHASCKNGGCQRPIYRGRVCFRCWAGIKWTSVMQRVANKNGNNNAYEGITLGFTRDEFIQWVLDNPPPRNLAIPSIDRIVSQFGYVPGNLRWLERDHNSAGTNKDLVALGMRRCSRCHCAMLATNENFPRTTKRGKATLSSFCKTCNRIYQTAWRKNRAGTQIRHACQ